MENIKQIKINEELHDIEDTQARNDIAAEVTNRTNADKALQEKININKNDISELKSDIDAEANERKEAYNAINASLESHGTRLNNLENYTIKLDSEGYIAVEYKG